MVSNAVPPFQLDGVGAAFLQHAHRAGMCLLRRGLVGTERKVGDHQRALGGPRDRTHGGNHLVHGHRNGVGVTQHVVSHGVTHQEHVNARGVEDPSGHCVVGRQHRQAFSGVLGGPEGGNTERDGSSRRRHAVQTSDPGDTTLCEPP